MQNKNSPSVYISHAWGGESEKIVQAIVARFEQEGIPLTIDKKDLGYRQSISQFMLSLGKADAIVIVVSNKYLHSEYCMFELLQIYESDNIQSRIFPIVLDEVKIAKSTERLELVKYWQDQTIELEQKIRELQSLSNIEGITEDLNLYHNIRNKIAKLTSILKDINALNINVHKSSDFNHLIAAVKKQILFESALSTMQPPEIDKEAITPTDQNLRPEPKKRKKRNWLRWMPVFIASAIVLWGSIKIYSNQKSEIAPLEIALQDSTEVENLLNQAEDTMTQEIVFANKESTPKSSDFQTNKSPIINPPNTFSTQKENTSAKNNPIIQEEKNTITQVKEPEKTTIDNKKEPENKAIPVVEDAIIEEKKIIVTRTILIPEQIIEGIFVKSISSNEVEKDDIFYIETASSVIVDGIEVIAKKAKIRSRVTLAKSSSNGERGSLGVVFEAVQSVSGDWLEIQYPELSDKKRGEIVFEKGLKISKLRLIRSSIKLSQ